VLRKQLGWIYKQWAKHQLWRYVSSFNEFMASPQFASDYVSKPFIREALLISAEDTREWDTVTFKLAPEARAASALLEQLDTYLTEHKLLPGGAKLAVAEPDTVNRGLLIPAMVKAQQGRALISLILRLFCIVRVAMSVCVCVSIALLTANCAVSNRAQARLRIGCQQVGRRHVRLRSVVRCALSAILLVYLFCAGALFSRSFRPLMFRALFFCAVFAEFKSAMVEREAGAASSSSSSSSSSSGSSSSSSGDMAIDAGDGKVEHKSRQPRKPSQGGASKLSQGGASKKRRRDDGPVELKTEGAASGEPPTKKCKGENGGSADQQTKSKGKRSRKAKVVADEKDHGLDRSP